MTETEALARMVAPGTPRPGKYRQGVIQILVTSACDKACIHCTQASNLVRRPWFMTPDQFRQALASLRGYWGVYGLFGGNPAVSPHFEDYCRILQESGVPKEQRGIWCNNPLTVEKARLMRETFSPSVSNLNVHLDRKAYSLFKAGWPECGPVGLTQDSRHAPVFVAMRDVIADEGERWGLISGCSINQHWSALIGVFRGELRAFFCEVAGAQAILHQDEPDYPDTGVPIWHDVLHRPRVFHHDGIEIEEPEDSAYRLWWQLPIEAFAPQVRKHCHECSVPLNGYGELAQAADGVEQTSATHAAAYRPRRKGRRVEVVTDRVQLGLGRIARATDYLGNARK